MTPLVDSHPVMNAMAQRVLARHLGASLLKTPGRHEFEVEAGPYEVTIGLTIPNPQNLLQKGDRPSALASVDTTHLGDWESFEEYADDIPASVGRKLGVRVTWAEGAWGRERAGVRTRHLSIRR